MRPAGSAQSYLENPLNELLSTPANVRLLRLLATGVSGPVAAPDAASYTGLTEAGARRALKRMADTGFVERIGSGRTQQFRLREADPLTSQIRALFQAEQERYHAIIAGLSDSFNDLPQVRVAWIDDLPVDVGQPMHIGVLADSRSLTHVADELRSRILRIESEFDMLIEVHAFSPADVPDVDWNTATLLAGVPLVPERRTTGQASHAQIDARASRSSKAIAELLDRDPGLLKRAERHIESLSSDDRGTSSHDIQEWKDILANYSRRTLKNFLVADTPRAQRLRQSSPFVAALTAKQRDELRKVIEQDDA